MKQLFNTENVVWKFIGRMADFFLLSLLWAVCCLPVVTIGASTSALFYITMKMAADQEGEIIKPFFAAFRRDLKQATGVWLIYLVVGVMLGADFLISLQQTGNFGWSMRITFVILAFLWALFISFAFALVARCDNTVSALLKMGIAITLRNFLPVLGALAVNLGIAAVGLFMFWPLLLVAPALAAYLNSFIFGRLLEKYQMDLPSV